MACTATCAIPHVGGIMICGSMALMVWHWLPVVVLAWIRLGVFAVHMHMKEASVPLSGMVGLQETSLVAGAVRALTRANRAGSPLTRDQRPVPCLAIPAQTPSASRCVTAY